MVVLALALWVAGGPAPQAALAREDGKSTADHTKFKDLQRPFASGPEVTEACLACHTEAAKQLMNTLHWTWEFTHPQTGQALGKRNVINAFCGNVVSNEPRCTSCHIGYGWEDMTTPASQALDETKVDCLVCHDTTGEYWKLDTGAGHPIYLPTEINGETKLPPNLTRIAQKVGPTSRANCGACHFNGGGGDGVKHGDLDSSLVDPPESLDVHMSKDGADMTCATCHNPDAHGVPGSRYATMARDEAGMDTPTGKYQSHASCESCHGTRPHEALAETLAKLNDHTDRLACQTCHIPEFARGGVATKTWWDWSTAGRLGEDGKPLKIKDDHGHFSYMSTKGDFRYEEDVIPTYAWFDGHMRYTLRDEPIDDTGIVALNHFEGGPEDPTSRIWPFKVMRGKQPYDTENKTLLVNHVFGKDDAAFWTHFNWEKALEHATTTAGQPYSGHFGFVETTMAWPITHMVAPAEDALHCNACHTREGGRMADLTGFYMPGRDTNHGLSLVGWSIAGLTLLGVIIHTLIRVVAALKRRAS